MWKLFLRPRPLRLFSTSSHVLRESTAYLTKLAARKPPPVLLESDLEESFIKGSGPGGQKINKTSNCVQLKHTPTGIVIKCQETRSREENRRIARRLLVRKLDVMENGEDSWEGVRKWKAHRTKSNREKKSRRKYRKLEEEKAGKLLGGDVPGEEVKQLSEGQPNPKTLTKRLDSSENDI